MSVSERTEEGTTVVVLAATKPPVAADYSEAPMCHGAVNAREIFHRFGQKVCSILIWCYTKGGR